MRWPSPTPNQESYMMTSTYTITAGDNSTDLGLVGSTDTLLNAKRIGRAAVRNQLPNQQGRYKIRNADGNEVANGERSIRTGGTWCESK
jgi:hypothetical protein